MRTISQTRERSVAADSSVDLEISRTTLIATTQELAAALANAAPTLEISQERAFAVAIADVKGGIVAIDNPQQLGSIAQTVAHVAGYFEFDLTEGDIILTNDPYTGGTKVQDLTLLAPFIVNGELVLHLAVRVRIRDIGGQLGGNLYPAATEILAEGVPFTPVKIQRAGRPVRDMLAAFLLNGRRPEETRRILDTARAALALGQRRLAQTVAGQGLALTRAALKYAQDYSERLARQAISEWKPGSYEDTRLLELDTAAGGPVAIRLTATVDQDALILDFGASDDQRPVFINSSAGSTTSCAISAVLTILGDSVPANSGLLRAVQVRTRPGTVTHPISPAPVGWGDAHCGNEIIDIVAATLQSAAGLSLPALTVPRSLVLARSANDRSDQLDLGRWSVGGSSALTQVDGWGRPNLSSRAELPSIEQWEADNDLMIDSFEVIQDSGGAGQWSGSPGFETVIALRPDRLYTLWTVKANSAVNGIAGGTAGGCGEVDFHTADGWQPAPQVANEQPVAADRLRLRCAGGGGSGDPRARERSVVINDLADGLISAATARDVYRLDVDEINEAQRRLGIGKAGIGND